MKFTIIPEPLFEMANITRKRSHLSVDIWSEHSGIQRNVKHKEPRVKLSKGITQVAISIESEPKVLAHPIGTSKSKLEREFKDGIDYVGRNYDLFLKHYNDTDDSFDDEDLFNELRKRKEYN